MFIWNSWTDNSPSIVLIIIADQLASASDVANNIRQNDYKAITGEFNMPGEFRVGSSSAGDMFLGALLPGLVLVALYMIYVFIYARIKKELHPLFHLKELLILNFG